MKVKFKTQNFIKTLARKVTIHMYKIQWIWLNINTLYLHKYESIIGVPPNVVVQLNKHYLFQ